MRIESGKVKAEFLPDRGMLGASLQYSGIEILRRIEDLESSARKGSSAGIPILYPWANRLSQFEFDVADKKVSVDKSSPLIHLDEHGLPLHGVPWPMLKWQLQNHQRDRLSAELNWNTTDLLQIFPFPHHVQMTVVAQSKGLNIETIVKADANSKVPISFGYHPYIGIPRLNRSQWKLKLPPMKSMVLNEDHIPTGEIEEFNGFDNELASFEFDHGFELLTTPAKFSIEGSGWKISIQLVNGYTHAQIFAPTNKDFIALEPMNAPTNALVSGKNLRVLNAGENIFCII